MKKRYPSPAMASIHGAAADLYKSGGIDQETMSKFDALCIPSIQKIEPTQDETGCKARSKRKRPAC